MAKKNCCCIIISSIFCLSAIAMGITLIIFAVYQQDYYSKKFRHTVLHVANYSAKNESCTYSFTTYSYSGYVILTYNAIFNNTKIVFYTNISHICGMSYKDAIHKAQKDYPFTSTISAWYFVDDPTIWIRYRPQGELYLIGGLCTAIVFAFSLMILIIYVCRRIKKNQRKQQIFYQSLYQAQ